MVIDPIVKPKRAHARRAGVGRLPLAPPPPKRQGAWVMRSTHELPHWVNPLTPLGVKGAWVNSERQVFRWLQHVVTATLHRALFQILHIDCYLKVGLLFVLILNTTNLTEYC